MTGILNLLASGKPPAAAVTAYQIERSLRFNSSDSAYLSWTPPVAGNRKTWTWSGWIKRSVLSSSEKAIFIAGSTLTEGGYFNIAFSNDKLVCGTGAAELRRTTADYRDTSAWYHVVVAIDTTKSTAADRVKIYVNGLEVTTFDTNAAPTQNVDTAVNSVVAHNCGRNSYNSSNFFDGYITDVHFIDGQQLTPAAFGAINATTGVWTPSAYTGTYGINGFRLPFNDNSSALNLGCNTAQTGDELWPYTTLHLSGNPANTSGYNCFSDKSSQNSGNGFPITVNGDTRSSSFSPYNTNYSAYFDNTNDYISYNTSDANLAIAATDNFCVECWVYYDTAPNYEAWFQAEYRTGALTSNCMWFGYNSGSIVLGRHASTNFTSATQTFNQGQWYHLVGVRQAGNVAIFVNGTRVANASSNTMDAAQNGFNIGNIYPGGYMGGYISNVRYIRSASGSTMPYDPTQTTISVPTTQLTAVTGTRVLACQGNRFLDASSNNYTLTVNDAPRITNFGPFLETDTTSGSGYFDGTSDSLTVSSNVVSATGAFTIEAWIFPTSSTANQCIIAQYSGNAGRWQILFNAAGKFELSGASTYLATTGTYTAINVWYHVVFQRDISNNLSVYINGKRDGTANNAISLETTATYIGDRNTGGTPFFGYISDLKVSNTAIYSGTDITVPTTKANSTASTTLLTLQDRANYNNSGFQDSSGNNHIITRPSGANVTQGSFSPFSNSGWSNLFNGSSGYISALGDAGFAFGTDDFTIEMWVNITGTNAGLICHGPVATAGSWMLEIGGSTFSWQAAMNANLIQVSASSVLGTGWKHVAVTRASGTTRLFVDGGLLGSSSAASNFNTTTGPLWIGRSYNNAYTAGHISNVRVIKGQALYTGAFTPPVNQLTATSVGTTGANVAASLTGTVSLLTCQSNRFIDLSSNNFTITRNGDTKVLAFSPFTSQSTTPTSYSAYFNGTTDYLSTLAPTMSSNWTVELWWYPTVGGAVAQTFFTATDSANSVKIHAWSYNNQLIIDNGVTGQSNFTGVNFTLNQWNHIAFVRNGATTTGYINGAVAGSNSFVPGAGITQCRIGSNIGVYFTTGHISNFRIVEGVAVYTGAFTAPTQPLGITQTASNNISAITSNQTALLTLQNNRIIDNSTYNKTITVNGSVAPREFNPFGNTVTTMAYSPTVHGGSGYFDDNGDYLSVANHTAFKFGTGDFTVEGWFYLPVFNTAYDSLFTIGNYTDGILMRYQNVDATNDNLYIAGSYYNWGPIANFRVGAWNHVALVRNGSGSNNLQVYVNGISVLTATNTTNLQPAGSVFIGTSAHALTDTWGGYISSFRIVKGTAAYTSNFTPPSGPVTAIPGTSLLLNFNNAGIVDYTGKNVLETLGNASNVTSLKKSLISAKGSLYFDGTGDWLISPKSTLYEIGGGDWTCEFWVYGASFSSTQIFAAFEGSSGSGYAAQSWVIYASAGKMGIEISNGSSAAFSISSTSSISTNAWAHLAITRSGSTWRMFVNGVLDATTGSYSGTPFVPSNAVLSVGAAPARYPMTGYIQDLRITKYARYTGTFTPPVRTFAHNVLDIGHKQWTPVNFSVASGAGNDSLVDTPTPYGIDAAVAGSYATFDAASSSVTLSNGNLTLTGVGGSGYNKANTTTAVSSGKWYFEATLVSAATDTSIGISQGNSSSTYPGQEATSYAYVLEKGQKFNGNSPAAYAASLTAGDVFMCAFDLDNNKLFFGKNGSWFASSNPATGANPAFTLSAGTYRAVGRPYGTNVATFNFGASTFAYTPPAGFAGLQDFVSGGVVRGNYCTLNPLSNSGSAPTNGGLTKPGGDGVYTRCNSTMAVSTGKWYFETVFTTTGTVTQVGIGQGFITNKYIGEDSLSYSRNLEDGNTSNNSVSSGNSATYAAGDIFMCAIDLDNNKLWFGKNGVWINTGANPAGNPAAGTNPAYNITPGTYSVATRVYGSGSLDFNFGQRPFNYTAPSGFKALCTQNLSTPSIVKSNTAFDALVWSGDGVNNRKLTTNFSPDLFWVKARNSAAYHSINDSVRGANAILQTNTTSAEQVNSNGYVTTFAADGVNITNGSDINASGTNYVGWAWDAGTTTVTNTAGTISAQVRANPTTGFSIVSYTGVAGGNSVGHGLGVAPKFIIVKGRTTSAWIVYTQMTGVNAYLYLHTSGASVSDVGIWSGTGSGVTSSTFGVRGASDNGLTGVNLIAYCFAEVPGFSSFGQWTGNGSADGPFIYTDFKPAVVIAKQTNTSGQNWYILNNESSTYNVVNRRLYPNLSLDESADGNINCDFVSNGFKLRDAYTGWNASGGTYIYAAFAENPFKYSLAR